MRLYNLMCAVCGAFAGVSPASVMPGFMRSSSAACWLWLVLLYDALLHLVHAVTVEDTSEYQACLASPATCTELCDSLPFLERFLKSGWWSQFYLLTPERSGNGGWADGSYTPGVVDVVMGGGVG